MKVKTSWEKAPTGWFGITAPLGLGLIVAAMLAFQAFDASREHRLVAERTVQDHADFAAYLLAELVDQRLDLAMEYAFYQENRAHERAPHVAVPPELLRDANEIARCEAVIPAESRFFFRLALESGEFIVDGPLANETRDALVAELVARLDPSAEESGQLFLPHDTAPIHISYRMRLLDGPARVLVYGMNSCMRDFEGDIFHSAEQTPGVLPPTLVGGAPNDSLFQMTVVSSDVGVIHGGPLNDEYKFIGSSLIDLHNQEELTLSVTIPPAVAEQLVIGGLPPSRLPVAMGLVLLTAVLMTLGVLQMRRRQELIQLRERFVGNVSHELRTPLQQILLYVDLLRMGRVKTEQERDDALRVVHRESHRVIGLVENILHLSRSATAEPKLSLVPANLTEIVQGTVGSFRPLAESRDVTVEVNDSGPCTAIVDVDAMRQVLLNLLDNATKYGPEGQRVTVDVSCRNGNAWVSVSDQGLGVPTDERDNIWDAFYRLDREDERAISGSGIGLSIVRSLVHGMGGEVGVETASGEGACFVITLPAANGGTGTV